MFFPLPLVEEKFKKNFIVGACESDIHRAVFQEDSENGIKTEIRAGLPEMNFRFFLVGDLAGGKNRCWHFVNPARISVLIPFSESS